MWLHKTCGFLFKTRGFTKHVAFCLKRVALQIIQILFALNGDCKESIRQ